MKPEEILFKAKRSDKDEWIEGLLVKTNYTEEKYCLQLRYDNGTYPIFNIDTATLRQFIRNDSEGNKIFTGEQVHVNWETYDGDMPVDNSRIIIADFSTNWGRYDTIIVVTTNPVNSKPI